MISVKHGSWRNLLPNMTTIVALLDTNVPKQRSQE